MADENQLRPRSAIPDPAAGDEAFRSKKRAIMDAARPLFEKHGYDRVSVDEISEAAGISKATLYSVFRSKDDLLCEVFIDQMLGKMSGISEECAKIPDPLERLRASIALALETTARNEFLSQILSTQDGLRLPIWTNAYAKQLEPIIVRRYAEPLQACIDRGVIREVDVETTAYLIYRLIQAVSVASISGQYPAAILRDQMLEFVMHALRR